MPDQASRFSLEGRLLWSRAPRGGIWMDTMGKRAGRRLLVSIQSHIDTCPWARRVWILVLRVRETGILFRSLTSTRAQLANSRFKTSDP
jgi:hypothetical protein